MASTPEHWHQLTGPSNWFQLAYPPHWQHEERDGAAALRPSGSDAFVAINTIWFDDSRSGASPGLQDIIDQFPKSRHVQRLGTGDFDGLTECVRGEASLAPPVAWWRRLFVKPHWRHWTMWAFRRDQLLIVFTLLHSGERDNELEALTRMMLGTLQIPETPADPPEVFAQHCLQLAQRKFPLLEAKLGEEFQLELGGSRLNLFNFYRAYVRETHKFEEILLPALTTVVQVQEWGTEQTEPPLDAVRDRLMPMLYPEDAWQERFPDFAGSPWVAGLAILYVVDEHNAYWYVRDDLAEKWGLTLDELHEIAIENLQQHFETEPMEMAVAGSEEEGPSMLMPGKPDSYNACRLLSQPFLAKLRSFVGGDLAIGVPGRDFFVAVSMKAESMLEHVRARVQEDFRQTDHPLTDRMLLITADGVSELIDESA
ncbi:MAG: DUF1444 family protein [Planctomycetaceae bacterium]|nr:DUF1444 family protein [Planctomycetaceae bacterium]